MTWCGFNRVRVRREAREARRQATLMSQVTAEPAQNPAELYQFPLQWGTEPPSAWPCLLKVLLIQHSYTEDQALSTWTLEGYSKPHPNNVIRTHSQLEEMPNGQIRDNLSSQNSNELQHIEEKWTQTLALLTLQVGTEVSGSGDLGRGGSSARQSTWKGALPKPQMVISAPIRGQSLPKESLKDAKSEGSLWQEAGYLLNPKMYLQIPY